MNEFQKKLSDFVDAECVKLMQHVHETLYPRKLATMWFRWAKNENKIFEWEFNHLEDGHSTKDLPTPNHPSQANSWAGGKWAKAFVQLDETNKVEHFLQF